MSDNSVPAQHPWSQELAVVLCACLLSVACASQRPQTALPPAPVASGGDLFQSYCAACHQYDGQAVGQAPPLDNSPWVTGPENRLIRIVLHGIRGEIQIEGKSYNREMPGFAQILSDADAASLLTFVRTSFGASSNPISAAVVKQVRTTYQDRTDYWTVGELLREP